MTYNVFTTSWRVEANATNKPVPVAIPLKILLLLSSPLQYSGKHVVRLGRRYFPCGIFVAQGSEKVIIHPTTAKVMKAKRVSTLTCCASLGVAFMLP